MQPHEFGSGMQVDDAQRIAFDHPERGNVLVLVCLGSPK
jgi:hypothetical protein